MNRIDEQIKELEMQIRKEEEEIRVYRGMLKALGEFFREIKMTIKIAEKRLERLAKEKIGRASCRERV